MINVTVLYFTKNFQLEYEPVHLLLGLVIHAFALYLPESEKQDFNFFAFVSPHASYILVTSILILIGTGFIH